jgi:hypothetical protein
MWPKIESGLSKIQYIDIWWGKLFSKKTSSGLN